MCIEYLLYVIHPTKYLYSTSLSLLYHFIDGKLKLSLSNFPRVTEVVKSRLNIQV